MTSRGWEGHPKIEEGEDDQRPPRGIQKRKKGTARAGNHAQKQKVV